MRIPIFVWVMLALGILGMLARALISHSTRNKMEQAKELADCDDWEKACKLYKEVLLERMDDPETVKAAAEGLKGVYDDKGIQADLSGLNESIALLAEIEASKTSGRKKAKLVNQLGQKVLQIVKELPPDSQERLAGS